MAKAEDTLDNYVLDLSDFDFDAMTAISFVDLPAIEEDFKYFAKQKKSNFSKINCSNEKQIVTGPALIPNKEIYRYDLYHGEYNIIFTKDNIEQLRNQFLKSQKQNNVTIDHAYNANNIYLVEAWTIEDSDNDKANALGFNDLPAGTLMMSYKIDNLEIWNSIKAGELKGFSIEAFLTHNLVEMSNNKITDLFTKLENLIDNNTFDISEQELIKIKNI